MLRAIYISLALALMASPALGQSQNLEDVKVTVELQNENLASLFKKIESQSKLTFAYIPDQLKEYQSLTLPSGTRSVKETLDLALANTNLTYRQSDNSVVIFQKEAKKNENDQPEQTGGGSGSLHYVSGRVLDSKGGSLPGVNILIRGTSEGTVTDAEGKYSLQVTGSDLLLFSFIGFKRFETEVGERTVIDVTLEEETATLNAVTINAGYYETTDELKTGSIAKVTAKDIERQPITSPLMALQGRMPGVDITPNSGVAGAAPNVVIRGRNSISNTNSTPLYIIDGIPVNSTVLETDNSVAVAGGFDPLSTLNPANIESFEVLKDADATAIYGSRGANGVILITTKRGKQSEKTDVDVSFYAGAGKIPRFLNLLTTPQYVAIRKEALNNAGVPVNSTTARDIAVWDTTRYTNWQKELLGGSASITDIQANIASGNKYTTFRFGGGYHHEGTIYPGDFGFRRINGNFAFNHSSSNQKFKASVTMNYGIESNKLFSGFSLADKAITLPPNAPALYDASGNLNWANSTFDNPLAALRKTDTNKSTNLILNSSLSYEIVAGLSLRANLGYNILNRNSITKVSPFGAMDPASITPTTTAMVDFGLNRRDGWIVEPQATYDKQFGRLTLNAVAGATLLESSSGYQLVQASGYSSDVLLESLKGATQTTFVNDNNSQYRYSAIFSRVGLNYKQKYILNLTGRRDGSSRFGPDHRWGSFGAVGGAWIFSEEKFAQLFSFLSFGKLRGSYGVTGSDQVGDYQYISTYQYTPYTYQGRVNLMPTGLANSNYAWEQTVKLEAALELGLFKDRIHVEAALYRNRCGNQLLNYQLPGITGFAGVTKNLNAVVENEGLELSLRTMNIDRTSFQWRSSMTFTLPVNRLVSYPDIEQSPYANTYVVGQPLTIAKLYNYLGVNPTTGLYQVRDVDGNGSFDYRDQTFIQNTGRVFYGGLTNALTIKKFELSFLLQFSRQTSYNSVLFAPGSLPYNLLQDVIGNYWREGGDLVKYQKATTDYSELGVSALANGSNAAYVSSSFIRLKTLSFSYTLPSVLFNKVALKAGKIFLQGQNLITFSDFNALDPEARINSLPQNLVITIGLDVKL